MRVRLISNRGKIVSEISIAGTRWICQDDSIVNEQCIAFPVRYWAEPQDLRMEFYDTDRLLKRGVLKLRQHVGPGDYIGCRPGTLEIVSEPVSEKEKQ